MKKNMHFYENSVEKVLKGNKTAFLTPLEFKNVISKLKKSEYKIYKPYPDSDKVILYAKEEPLVSLYEIISNLPLRHQDIMGAILNLGLVSSCFGDVVITNQKYYFYVLSEMDSFIENNLNFVGREKIVLRKVPIETLESYEKSFIIESSIVPSLRLDVVVGAITKKERDDAIEKISNKEVIVNYEEVTKRDFVLKENDVFSIRRYGKYKFIGIKTNTKKDRLVIEYMRYI